MLTRLFSGTDVSSAQVPRCTGVKQKFVGQTDCLLYIQMSSTNTTTTTCLLCAAIILGCLAMFFALRRYFSSRVKLPKLPEIWWAPGTESSVNNDIRPYKVTFSEEVVKDLKYRLEHSRPLIPPLKNVAWSYGTNTDALQKFLHHWAKIYNFEEREKYINQYSHFKTNIQGLDIHFIHVKPSITEGKRVLPLLIVHGWPGSIMEFYKIIPLLTSPRPEHDFVFEVIAPSLPGFGFSSAATIPDLSSIHMSVIFKNLMLRLGHDKFYVQGGDWGASVIHTMSCLYPQHVLGMHSNLCLVFSKWILLKKALYQYLPSLLPWAKTRKGASVFSFLEETGYFHIQATKPDTVGVGLNDSPAGLAAYIIEKFSTGTNPSYKWRVDGGLLEKYTYDELIDNLMIYWVSNSITTAMRIYAEQYTKPNRSLTALLESTPIKVPSACVQFPHEIMMQEPDELRKRFVNLLRVTKMPRGGHFAAFEEPELLANDIWVSVDEMEKWNKKHNDN